MVKRDESIKRNSNHVKIYLLHDDVDTSINFLMHTFQEEVSPSEILTRMSFFDWILGPPGYPGPKGEKGDRGDSVSKISNYANEHFEHNNEIK